MGYYADLIAVRDAYRAAESRAYKADEIINGNRSHLRYRIGEANPAKWTLGQFHKEDVFAEGSTFLVITTRGPYRGCAHQEWLLETRIVDGATPEARDLAVYTRDGTLLPLSGPAVDRHAPLRRLAAVARGVLNRNLPNIDFPAWEASIVASNEAHAVALDKAGGYRTIGTEAERAAIISAHPDLARRMAHHDWSHDYADRHIASAAEAEREIKAALRLMDIDDAALLLAAMRAPVTYSASYLYDHPQLVRTAA